MPDMYIGVADKARKVVNIYIGVAGKARLVSNMYAGIDGKARLCYSGKIKQPLYTGTFTVTTIGAYVYMHLLTSGTLTIQSKGDYDLFAVGGGSSGVCFRTGYVRGGGGGGGGYTNYTLKQVFNKSQTLAVSIGAGGAKRPSEANPTSSAGSATSIGGITAQGGSGGSATAGANGGSGGGSRGVSDNDTSEGGSFTKVNPGNGGSNGSDGQLGARLSGLNPSRSAGTGQGTTTRAFGNADGTLYAGGGGGGGYLMDSSEVTRGLGGAGGGGHGGYRAKGSLPTAGTSNTGGGGGGGSAKYVEDGDWDTGAAGGSGIAIIRWPA